ncbi:MAG: hypothetical protein SGARI_005429 [Bacillariaceae sp.]
MKASDSLKASVESSMIVSFADTCNVRPTISRKSYSEQEKACAWYSGQEFKTIQSKSLKLVQLLDESGGVLQGRRYCTRGLEGLTQDGYQSKKMNRITASMVVLDEQENQLYEKGKVDYDVIASEYQQVTSSSQLWAHVVGMRDFKVAMVCYEESTLPTKRESASEGPSTLATIPEKTLTASPMKQIETGARATRKQANAKAA